MRDAIKLIEDRRDTYIKEHCQVFPDGHYVTTPAQQEYIGELDDIIATLARSAEKGGQSPTIDAALNRFEEAALYRQAAGDHYKADDYSEYLESRRGIVSLITTHQEAWVSGFSQGTRMARAALGLKE